MNPVAAVMNAIASDPNVSPALAKAVKPPAPQITTRNRASVSIGKYNLCDPSMDCGNITFHLAEDAPGRFASFSCSAEVAESLKHEDDPYELVLAMFKVGATRFGGFSDQPDLKSIKAYLEQEHVAERDDYLHAIQELPKLEKEIGKLESRRDLYRRRKASYEAARN